MILLHRKDTDFIFMLNHRNFGIDYINHSNANRNIYVGQKRKERGFEHEEREEQRNQDQCILW